MGRVDSLPSHSGFSSRGHSYHQCWKNPCSQNLMSQAIRCQHWSQVPSRLLSASPGAVSQEHLDGVHVLQGAGDSLVCRPMQRKMRGNQLGSKSFFEGGKSQSFVVVLFCLRQGGVRLKDLSVSAFLVLIFKGWQPANLANLFFPYIQVICSDGN